MELSSILITFFIYVGILSLIYFRNHKLYSCLTASLTALLCLSSSWICQTAAKIPALFVSINEWINHLPLINISINGYIIDRMNILVVVLMGLFLVSSICAILYGEVCEERFKKRMSKYENGSSSMNE